MVTVPLLLGMAWANFLETPAGCMRRGSEKGSFSRMDSSRIIHLNGFLIHDKVLLVSQAIEIAGLPIRKQDYF